MVKFSAQFATSRHSPDRSDTETCSLHTHFRTTTVFGEADAASATSGTQHEMEDQLMARLAGKVAVITGGSRGIGFVTAPANQR